MGSPRHIAHAADADERNDLVRSDARACLECHVNVPVMETPFNSKGFPKTAPSRARILRAGSGSRRRYAAIF